MSLIDLYISDGGKIRRIGDNQHDMLTIEDGELCYYNLQNGDGCRLGEDGEWYKFVENADEYGYNCDPRKTEPTISKMEQVDKDINVRSKDEPTTQTETQNSNLTFEKDECAKEYEELGLKELKELIEADRKTEQTEREGE